MSEENTSVTEQPKETADGQTSEAQTTEGQATSEAQASQSTEGQTTETQAPSGMSEEVMSFIQNLMEQQRESGTTETKDESSGEQEAPNIPEHWDKYEASAPVPDEVKRMAHQSGLTQEQFNATLDTFGKYMQAQKMVEHEQLKQQGVDFIKKEWGDKAEYHLNLARRALRTVDKDGELKEVLDQTGFGNHPVVLKFFANLGKNLQEGGYLKGELKRPAGAGKTAAQRLYPNMPSTAG